MADLVFEAREPFVPSVPCARESTRPDTMLTNAAIRIEIPIIAIIELLSVPALAAIVVMVFNEKPSRSFIKKSSNPALKTAIIALTPMVLV